MGHFHFSTFDLDVALQAKTVEWMEECQATLMDFVGGSRDRETGAISTESEV